MALWKTITFEGGVPPNNVVVGGDILTISGTNKYTANSRVGAVGYESTNGGFISVASPSDLSSGSFMFQITSYTGGSARIVTFTDNAAAFHGMIRAHSSGLFDICDNTTTRQAVSVAGWTAGATWYRCDYQVSGTGTARFIACRIYNDITGALLWDSGAVAVTAASANPVQRIRLGAQGISTGVVVTDHVRLYDALEWAPPLSTPFAAFGVPL
jgi:hypothetical protein